MIRTGANAASAKVRVMFGRRIKPSEYRVMCECRTVDEVAGILRDTPYGPLLGDGVQHREQIEYAVGRRLYADLEGLNRYLPEQGGYLNEYFTGRYEVEQIVQAATGLGGVPMQGSSLVEFASHSPINTYALRVSRTSRDIANALVGTVYESAANEFASEDGMTVPQFEARLWGVLYSDVYKNASKHAVGAELQCVQDLFSRKIDMMNYTSVSRMKNYGKVSSEYLKSLIIPGGTLPQSVTDRMIRAEDSDMLRQAVKNTRMGRLISAYGDNISAASVREYIKYIRYSKYPIAVVAAYLFFIENEAANIVKITEGIRYSLDSDDIYGLLSVAE